MPAPTQLRPNRDSVTTIRSDGSRPFLFPADTRGRFTQLRRYAALVLIGIYLLLPWINVAGYPAVFLDVAARRFHLFGLTFAAQDMWLLFFLFTGVGFSLFIVTSLLGRIWCGWTCPQTVFLDHVFRRIERFIDGDAIARRKLHDAPWTAEKFFKRALKHSLFVVLSAMIMHLFLAYFVSIPEVWAMMRAAPSQHLGVFAFMVVSTGILYFNFAWFREQLCIVLCPYGRLQSVLIDDNTMVIGYDSKRGEPRGKAGTTKGDCVDCLRCVQVCPTGIDIRQGLQLECIGCTACIDVCDEVMTRTGRARGLVRYDSTKAFTGGQTRWIRPRTILYSVFLVLGICVASWAISTVKPASFNVLRMTGAPYVVEATNVRNQFLVRVVNKRNNPAKYVLHLQNTPDGIHQIGFDQTFEIGPLGEIVQPLVVQQDRAKYTGVFHFTIRIEDAAATYHLQREVEFLGPDAKLLRAEEDEHQRRTDR